MPNLIDLPWPTQGLVQSAALANQQPGTTTDCLNVRNYDVYDKRNRGGQRAGQSKAFATQPNGSTSIQRLDQAVQAFDPQDVVADTLLLSVANSIFGAVGSDVDDHADWQEVEITSAAVLNAPVGANRLRTATWLGDTYLFADADAGDSGELRIMYYVPAAAIGSAYIISCLVDPPDNAAAAGDRGAFGFFLRLDKTELVPGSLPDTTGEGLSIGWRATNETSAQAIQVQYDVSATGHLKVAGATGTNLGSTYSVTPGTPVTVELHVNGDVIGFYIDGNRIGSFESSVNSANLGFGLLFHSGATHADNNSPYVKDLKVYTGTQPASLRTSKVIAVAAGSVFAGTPNTGLLASSGGSGVLQTAGIDFGVQSAFQKVYLCDGVTADYKILTLASNTVTDWATAVTAGTLPQGSVDTTKGCRMMALFRGRIVMSGLVEEPHNWFMSKSGDPLDWDYSPATTSQIQAVAGNSSNVGELGDVVTALAPYLDDVLIMGGANSLWIMRGDPAAGGSIDNITRQVGIVGPDAWTWDLAGNFYFFGTNGLYRMLSGTTEPVLVSKNRLDKLFGEVDTAANRVLLAYDAREQGVHIFLSPITQPSTASIHYFYDERNDAFLPDAYPITHGPTAVLDFKGDDPTTSALMLGGYDGYVRQFDEDAFDDDGTNIASRVRLSPIVPGSVIGSARIDDIHVIFDQQGDPVTLKVWKGDTVEEAERLADAAGSPACKRVLQARRNNTIRHRIAANAFILELSQNGTAAGAAAGWAYESGMAKIQILSRMRGRHVS